LLTIYDLKPKFQALLRPACARLAKAGVTANQVTLAAFALSLAHGVCNIATGGERWVLAFLPLILFIRMGLNAIDGMLAREFAQQSKLGAMLNELTDVLSDAALYLPFAFIPGISPPLIVVAVLFGIIAELAGVAAIQIGASRRYDGPFGKSDRAFFFGALGLVLASGHMPGLWTNVALAVACTLGGGTIHKRTRLALREAALKESRDANT
jgi:CDP-diacylglycerol--glycerol-3-phosphate 3-phosphatidyltransferase